MPSSSHPAPGEDLSEPDSDPDVPGPGPLPRQCQAGGDDAFALLVAQFHERIYNFLLKMTRQPADAEDLTQETFLKAWRAIDRFDPRCSASAWLFTIAKRTALNHLRSHRHVAELSAAPEPTDGSSPSSILSQREEKHELWSLARTLKPKQYQVLWLRYGEGFSVAEIANIMRMHPIHARVLLHRGRSRLAKLLKTHQPAHLL
jgi:RNA polymerase sigma-70 factor, ECF subfamily